MIQDLLLSAFQAELLTTRYATTILRILANNRWVPMRYEILDKTLDKCLLSITLSSATAPRLAD